MTQQKKITKSEIASIIYWFVVIGLVTWLTIHTFIEMAYGINQTDTLERDTTAYMDTPKEFEQARTERDLQGCYSGFAILGNLYNNYYFKTIPLTPQELEKFIKDMCNFYHEKTGLWYYSPDSEIIPLELKQEFAKKYYDKYPKILVDKLTGIDKK